MEKNIIKDPKMQVEYVSDDEDDIQSQQHEED